MELVCKKCKVRSLVNASECEICREKRKNRQNKIYSNKRLSEKRVASGLCGRCGKNQLINATECISCREIRKEKQKLGYEERKEQNRLAHRIKAENYASQGLCVRCGKNKPEENKKNCIDCLRVQRGTLMRYKKIVFDHYGFQCQCCGESISKFLTLDHVNNDGAEHRRLLGGSAGGRALYLWIINNKYPDIFQVLCWNCNCGKKMNGGVCPHTE